MTDTLGAPLDTPPIDAISAKALSEMHFPAPRQLVRGIITEGLNILAGNPKSGKSFLSLGLALALANGTPALGTINIDEPTAVLYLALEDTPYRLKNRIKGLHQPPPENLYFATHAPRLSEGGIGQIDAFVQDRGDIGLVIIDTLAKISDVRTGGNVYDEDAATGTALHSLAHSRKLAVLVIHHTRKLAAGDFLHAVSGSAGLTGAADTVAVLTRKRNETTATLEVTGRDIHETKLTLTWNSTRGGWITMRDPTYATGPQRRDWE